MAEGVEATSAAEEGLDLVRRGLLFARPETEAAYREWHARSAVSSQGASTLSAGLGWAVILMFNVGDPHFGVVTGCAAVGALVLVARLAILRQQPRLLSWVLPSAALAGVVTVLLVVGPCWWVFGIPETAFAAVLIANYYFFAIMRLRPALATTAALSLFAFHEILLVMAYRSGSAGREMLASHSNLAAVALLTGLLVCVKADRTSRQNFRQGRIIESQKETIARERAKSEALLKNELSHQVAERSRELGDALARVGAPVALALPAPGDRFHTRYRVVRALGEGGMGAVFEVERLTDSQRLALKLVTGQVSGATAARFAREAEIGARVHHRNLISIVDVGIAEGGAPFLVMELVQGGSLEGRRARFGEVAWGLPVLKQIALGLSALHEAGVVHRDLKPGNVLLDGGDAAAPIAKISDFGISRFGQLDEAAVIDALGPTLGASTPKKSDLTGTGMLLGTPLYMAPEAARGGKSLDAAADVFAFGILAYEVLTGRDPFETPAVLLALAGKPLPPPAPIEDATLARAARDAVLACLSEDPRSRPSARRVCEAIGAA